MSELPAGIYNQLKKLCALGDTEANAGRLDSSKGFYISALELIPGDHRTWEASTWVYVAIGDVHFRQTNYDKSFKCFLNAVQCPGGLGNPYIHLRLGQLYFEDGNLDKSADELTRAYMGAGIDIFMEDDSKYLEFLEKK